MKHSFDFALTTYCQAKCRSCARTNQETGEKETWVPLQHMKLDVFEKRLKATQGHIENSTCLLIQKHGHLPVRCTKPDLLIFIDPGST